uniref:Lipid-binding serum glycoprotein C-terminal domain-containing protein n=1 Tax=Meloidogyne incognita TaxID=6306 RepID=A0A914KHL3_MELIC
MNNWLLCMDLEPKSHPFEEAGIRGNIFVSDVQTLSYRPPTQSNLHFVPPHFFLFSFENAAITLSGRFHGDAGPLLQIPGTVFGQLQGLNVEMATQLRAIDGLISVSVTHCRTNLRFSQFTINPEGLLGPILKIFEVTINDLIRQRIPDLLCRSLRDIVERNSPHLFQRITYIPLGEHFSTFGNGTDGVIERFVQRLSNGLFIDGRMVSDPVITNDYFETQQRGELRYPESYHSAPFFPQPIPIENDSQRMFYLYASDYTLNSMLYQAFQLDRLTIRVEEQSLPALYRTFVRTTCPDIDQAGGDFLKTICVGKLVPALGKQFPNTTTKFVMVPHQLPEMQFKKGLGTMDLKAHILTFIRDRQTHKDRQVLVSSADGTADIKLNAENDKFGGDLKLKKLLVRLHRSAIQIEPESISQLAPLAKMFLGPELAKALKQGLPFPLKDSMKFINPKITLHDGYVRLASDFELNEQTLRLRMTEAFERIKAESANNIGG